MWILSVTAGCLQGESWLYFICLFHPLWPIPFWYIDLDQLLKRVAADGKELLCFLFIYWGFSFKFYYQCFELNKYTRIISQAVKSQLNVFRWAKVLEDNVTFLVLLSKQFVKGFFALYGLTFLFLLTGVSQYVQFTNLPWDRAVITAVQMCWVQETDWINKWVWSKT